MRSCINGACGGVTKELNLISFLKSVQKRKASEVMAPYCITPLLHRDHGLICSRFTAARHGSAPNAAGRDFSCCKTPRDEKLKRSPEYDPAPSSKIYNLNHNKNLKHRLTLTRNMTAAAGLVYGLFISSPITKTVKITLQRQIMEKA